MFVCKDREGSFSFAEALRRALRPSPFTYGGQIEKIEEQQRLIIETLLLLVPNFLTDPEEQKKLLNALDYGWCIEGESDPSST